MNCMANHSLLPLGVRALVIASLLGLASCGGDGGSSGLTGTDSSCGGESAGGGMLAQSANRGGSARGIVPANGDASWLRVGAPWR